MSRSQIDLNEILRCCDLLLGRMHDENRSGEMDATIYNIVAYKLFGYAVNTFKSIFFILPHTIYECASVLERTLWETDANFAWIAREPEVRALRFAAFTAREHVRLLRKRISRARRHGDHDMVLAVTRQLADFERAVAEQLAQFRDSDRRGRVRSLDRFSVPTLEAQVAELGSEWQTEYERDYALNSMYAHGAPGAVLFPFHTPEEIPEVHVQDISRSCVVGASAIRVMSRIYRRWLGVTERADDVFLAEIGLRVRNALSV